MKSERIGSYMAIVFALISCGQQQFRDSDLNYSINYGDSDPNCFHSRWLRSLFLAFYLSYRVAGLDPLCLEMRMMDPIFLRSLPATPDLLTTAGIGSKGTRIKFSGNKAPLQG